MAIKSETVKAFIAEAQRELDNILLRKKELEELINKCKAVFEVNHPSPTAAPTAKLFPLAPMPPPARSMRRDRGKKLWEQIVDLLKELERDLSVNDIVQGFRERGWPLSAKNGSKIIYRAMKDKEGAVFIHTDRGTWDMKERTE